MPTVLDAIEELVIEGEPDNPPNEVRRLKSLGEGLSSLYAFVKQIEMSIAPADNSVQMMFMGPIPGVPLGLLECMFHWYSVSACNFCRLVGHLGHEGGGLVDPTGLRYAQRLCGAAYWYRAKVSAHFARYDPRGTDNQADIEYSVMNFPQLENFKFFVGGMRLTVTRGGVRSTTSHDTHWSLTELHEQLLPRFPGFLVGAKSNLTGEAGEP